ncbi:alpha/beta hydrolase family protein [Streptomyces sp. NPDC056480]|uniref:alpha/beta hydrolase family protein n=1 Tax=Streptomyces sp. NPDC056480 TaxID=3345833 RepID=UPI0036B77D6D
MGGIPLESSGRYIAFNRVDLKGNYEAVRVDTFDGSLHPLAPGHIGLQLLLARPETGDLLFAVGLPHETAFAFSKLDRATVTARSMQTPLGLNSLEARMRPLAFDSDGTTLYLALERGVRSQLICHHLGSDTQQQIDMPLGVITGPGAFHRGMLRFPFTTASRPQTLVTVALPSMNPRRGTVMSTTGPAAACAVKSALFETPDGPIEALVYGEHWATARRVIMALHGGPEAHWKAAFEPPLLSLAEAEGVAVIAVNQRGSTGYGKSHQAAINHSWGGPDLADIHHIADHITSNRSLSVGNQIMIYGSSYGAFLALLAASTRPGHWSHCVAIAPFLSGKRLYYDATPPVRHLLDRLGGHTEIHDVLGPRNLLSATTGLRAKTLLIHGTEDSIVPVSHSRELYQHLTKVGRCTSLSYVEAPGEGHSPRYDADRRPIGRLINAFFADQL